MLRLMPSELPPMTFLAAGVVPPIVLFKPPSIPIPKPLVVLATALPAASVPRKLPVIVFPLDWTRIPIPAKRLITNPLTLEPSDPAPRTNPFAPSPELMNPALVPSNWTSRTALSLSASVLTLVPDWL